MSISVYADVLFLINFCMNYIVLAISRKILNSSAAYWRIIVSAIVGSVYSILIFFPNIQFIYTMIIKFMVSIALAFIAFGFINKKRFILSVAVFYIVNFIFGGACMALLYSTNVGVKTQAIVKNGTFYMNLPLRNIILASLISYIFISGISWFVKNKNNDKIYDVRLLMNDKTIVVKGMLDTGNSLIDPVSKRPVIITEWNVVKKLLDYNGELTKITDYIADDKIRMIPYKSVGKKDGIMWGISIDEIQFNNTSVKNIIIGVYDGILSEEYNLLLHRSLMI